MALPMMNKKRKSTKRGFLEKVFHKATTSRKPPKKISEKRSESIGGAITKNLIATPIKAAGSMVASAAFKDIPELGILGMALSGFVSDVKHILNDKKEEKVDLKKSGDETSKKIDENTIVLKTFSKKLDDINSSLAMQLSVLDGGFGVLGTKLDGLDPIYTELRTLNSLTARANEISKKTLSNTRAQNKVQVMKEKNKRFEETQKTSHEKTIGEEEKEEKELDTKESATTSVQPKEQDKGFLGNLLGGLGEAGLAGGIGGAIVSAMSNLGSMIFKSFTALLEGSGLAKLLRFTPMAIIALLAETMGMQEIRQALKTDFSKIGKNLEEAFSKEGLKGAAKAFFSDEQIGALGKALLKGWDEVMKPITKGIEGILNFINPNLAKGVKKGVDVVETGIGKGLEKANNLLFGEGDTSEEDLKRINIQRQKSGLSIMTMDQFMNSGKKSKVTNIQKPANNDEMLAEQLKENEAMPATDIRAFNKPRLMAEQQAVEQNKSMEIEATKDAKIMSQQSSGSSGSGQVNINAPQNTSNSSVFNITSANATRDNWVRSYSESLKQP